MAEPTPEERNAFLWMQGRMVELLLRHDARRFATTFDTRTGDEEQLDDPRLRRYRVLAVLFYLRDDLFDGIIPRIKRRLSFVAPREVGIEELPPRGRIDWSRTMTASWRERPGELPLEVHTRQRRRHFATPENLLTVATLIGYRSAAQKLLEAESARDSAQAIRHPLHEIIDGCTRELVFPQFAGLVSEATRIVTGSAGRTVADLERAVADNLLPGRNSAYDDLLDWRRKLERLRLLERTAVQEVQPMLGADPARDNYLYQLWLFYELGDLLQRERRLTSWDQHRMVITWRWGADAEPCEYCLQHDQAIPGSTVLWPSAPGVRPDFYIARTDQQIVGDGPSSRVIWREPGFVLDAKYYRPRDSAKTPASPIKRMIADLQLTGERHGALLFAFHGGPLDALASDEAPGSTTPSSHEVAPDPALAQYAQPDIRIHNWRASPRISGDLGDLERTLRRVLDRVHAALKQRIEVRCRGVFLDSLSANAHQQLATAAQLVLRDGAAVDVPLDDLLLCPKPHVAPWRVDLVRLSHDCCQNAVVCHIKGQPNVEKPQRLTALEQIAEAIRGAATGEDDDAVIEAANQQVLAITQRYAQLIQPDLAHYERWVRDRLEVGSLFDTTPLLTATERETLALARFLWEQIDASKASNYAGPTLLFTGALEALTRATIYRRCPTLRKPNGEALMRSLGALGNSSQYPATWRMLYGSIVDGGYWNERFDPSSRYPLRTWIDRLRTIVDIRNQAAHAARVDRDQFNQIVVAIFGSSRTGIGLLSGLLLAWTEPVGR
ncbi:MAG TPA: hypothetical protein VFZ66_03880 [Herpetosiphonaceae bacterium]